MPTRGWPGREHPSVTDKITATQRLLAEQVGRLVSGEDWANYLRLQARFHAYSPGNVLLIAAQHHQAHREGRVTDPEPSLVAGYQTWKALGRQVTRGQSGYAILAPVRGVVRVEPEASDATNLDKKDPKAAKPSFRPVLKGFRVAHVWDYSQTEGRELPRQPAPKLLEGTAPAGLVRAVADLLAKRGFTLDAEADPGVLGEANGSSDVAARRVLLRRDLPEAAKAKTLLHEAGHVLLHSSAPGWSLPRATKEVEAESVAFVAAAACGLDTAGYSFPYLASWAGQDAGRAIQAAQVRIAEGAKVLIAATPAAARGGGRALGLPLALEGAGLPSGPSGSALAPEAMPL